MKLKILFLLVIDDNSPDGTAAVVEKKSKTTALYIY